jgi:hypothetical protein
MTCLNRLQFANAGYITRRDLMTEWLADTIFL